MTNLPIVLTIGELARLAGTTVKAVRHYHANGLLPEPPRDASGYRRYGAAALVRLLRIRRLRELGLSVPRVRELLAGGAATVREALAELDRELARKQREIAKQRKQIAELRKSTVDLELPGPVAEVLDGLPLEESDVDGALLELERGTLILLHALAPDRMAEIAALGRAMWLHHRDAALRVAALFGALADAPEDAPEVELLAAELAVLAEAGQWGEDAGVEGPGAALFADHLAGLSPAQRRAITLAGSSRAPGPAPGRPPAPGRR